jgi:hypothetical protein
MGQRSYTREEMEEILRRAAERTQAAEDGVRHDDLIAAAREAGIDPDEVEAALGELGAERTAEAAAARWTRIRRQRFWSHLSTYAIVMAFLASLNVLATPSVWWSLYVALAWGLFVALGARRAFLPPSDADVDRMLAREERAAAKKAKREERKRAAEAWQKRWREIGEEARLAAERRRVQGSPLARAEKEIDRAIEEGVNALVGALTKRAETAAREVRAPRTDFERYVATRRDGTREPSPPLVTPPPKTRVAVDDEREEVEERREKKRSRARE